MSIGDTNGERALEGVRIIDLTWLQVGPQATRLLATFGAQVIRVEWRERKAIDFIRYSPPFAPDHAALCARPWRNIPLPHPTWMGHRRWFRTHAYRLPEVRFAEDQELLLRASPTSCYACLGDVLLGYRQGPFRLRRTLVARRFLLAAQLRLFADRGQWGHAIRTVPQSIAKIGIDILAAIPGGETLFFVRMSEPASAAVIDELHRCLNPNKVEFASD